MNRMLAVALNRGISQGHLRVTYANGRTESYGDRTKEEVAIRFTDPSAEWALALDPALALGELYMDGRLMIESGTCYDLVALIKRNARRIATVPGIAAFALRYATSFAAQRQTLVRARRNIAHHYDLDERFYRLFLDSDMQYTCAYYEHPDQTLEQAQLAKKRHVTAKLQLQPGQRVLDIGSGWGGLCLYLAEMGEALTTGVTLSKPQQKVSTRRATERGLSAAAKFRLQDYRQVNETFDRIVSVGMFEAIGRKEFDNYFQTTARLLEKSGVFVLHSIGRTKPCTVPSPWMEKYIFPGSYIPALSEVLPAAERAGFLVTDVEILRLHYAETLREWRKRFLSNRATVLEIYDERFLRMWEFYLCAAEAGFRIDRMFIFQLQLTRHLQTVPLSRSYLHATESALRTRERSADSYAALAV